MNDGTLAVMLTIAGIVIAGFAAVGAVLLIKIVRRRQAATGMVSARLDTGVPTRPMSQQHADRLLRRYAGAALLAAVLLAIAAFVVLR